MYGQKLSRNKNNSVWVLDSGSLNTNKHPSSDGMWGFTWLFIQPPFKPDIRGKVVV